MPCSPPQRALKMSISHFATTRQKNLWNALKYSTAFPLVYAGYLRKTALQHGQNALARSSQ